MFTVEFVKHLDYNSAECFEFEFDTITQSYAFLWMHRHLWVNPSFDVILHKDDDVYSFFDDYDNNHFSDIPF